ncbi:GntR family transcriptional repressor for pyruvate dehydrogenase complex [Lachnospiraceae bacterium PM6-15]|uniref:FadR/GntR family transcriptional regulator n=1 Tax=Ohessyouella blattaphilus TaxID=2949333 RepID=UPI003E2D40F5
MNFAKLSAPTLKELFVKELEAMILSGKLKIGEKLPPERTLAERMQVSRAVVNGGIAELARKGFLQVKPRSGVYVVDYRRYGTAETLLSIMNYNGGHLRNDEIRSILEIKMIVDTLAAELAVEKCTDEDIEALEERLAEMGKHDKNDEATADATFDFYHELCMISDNTLLPLIYRSFRIPITHLWIRFAEKYGNETLCRNAGTILEALKARDKKTAREAIEKSLTAAISGANEIYEN